jgi:hypothetical protein
MAGGQRELRKAEIQISSSLRNIVGVNRLSRMRRTGLVARMGYMIHPYKFLMTDATERNLLEDEGVNRRVEGEKSVAKPRHTWVGTNIEIFRKTTA